MPDRTLRILVATAALVAAACGGKDEKPAFQGFNGPFDAAGTWLIAIPDYSCTGTMTLALTGSYREPWNDDYLYGGSYTCGATSGIADVRVQHFDPGGWGIYIKFGAAYEDPTLAAYGQVVSDRLIEATVEATKTPFTATR